MTSKRWVASVILFSVLFPVIASADLITFDSAGYGPVPYSEGGLTFSQALGSATVFAGSPGGSDGYLTSGTNAGTPIHIIVSSTEKFNLLSLDAETLRLSWLIRSSTGAEVIPTTSGTIDFSSLSGWGNISGFELIHDPGADNGSIRIDDVLVSAVPEPTSTVLFSGAMLLFALQRRKKMAIPFRLRRLGDRCRL